MIYLYYNAIVNKNLLDTSWSSPHYTWWDQEIFDGLESDNTKDAYRLAAYLHDGIERKNKLPYLTHINGSLQKLEQYKQLLWDIDMAQMQMLICLHDVAEDDDIGVELIAKEFGIDTLIDVLWMSVPKKRVRDGVEKLIQRIQKYGVTLEKFISMHNIVQIGRPTDDGFMDSVIFRLEWDWYKQWESFYKDEYIRQPYSSEERRDIFAKYIFGAMIENMPEHLFLVKCIERLDNLSDREWLKNPKDSKTYIRTARLTEDIYCKRLDALGYTEFADTLRSELAIWVNELQEYVRSQVQKNTTST